MLIDGSFELDVLVLVPFLGYGGAETQLRALLRASAGCSWGFASFIDDGGPIAQEFPDRYLGKFGAHGMAALIDQRRPRAILFHHDGRPLQAVAQASHTPERVVWARHTRHTPDLHHGRWGAGVTHVVSASRSIALGDPRETVIYNGVDLAVADAAETPQKKQEFQCAGCVSRLDSGKHLGLLVEALALNPSWIGLVIGDGLEADALWDDAKALRLKQRFMLFPATTDVYPWYKKMDLVVLPTEVEGGVPLTLLEAAAAGVPCAIPAVSDVRDFFTDGQSVFLLDNPDLTSVHLVLERATPEACKAVGRGARAVVEREFPLSRMINQYFEVLGCHRS